jgi:hypothetical protein
VFSPPPELSPPPEWIGWAGGYEYEGGAWPPIEPLAGGGEYEYGGETWPLVKPLTEEGGYEYGGYPYGGGGGYGYGGGAPVEHRSELEGINMVEDMTVEVVEKEHEGVVLAKHWIGDGAERHRWTHREWEEFAKSGCSEGHTTFVNQDSNCLTWCKMEKSEEESENEIKYVWNELKP